MAITNSHLGSVASGTDATSYTTGSISPSANTFVYAFVENSRGSSPALPTLTSNAGLTLTWVQEETVTVGSRRLTLFRGRTGAAPGSGTVTADFGASTQTGGSIIIGQLTDLDSSGTNGSGAVLQSTPASGTGTTGSVTLSSFGSASNGVLAGFQHDANEATAPGSGFTETAGQDVTHAAPVTGLAVEWRADNDTSVDASWTTSALWLGIAVELVAAGAGAPVNTARFFALL